MHLAVDTQSELPVSLEVTPANVYHGEMAISLMAHVAEDLGWKFKFVMMDAGYDQMKNYVAARNYGAQAIIALNKRGEKEPPEGMSTTGTPRCSMGYDMVYWSADGDRLKFRCPHALGKVDCPFGSAACSDSLKWTNIIREITSSKVLNVMNILSLRVSFSIFPPNAF
nr:transposase [Alicyclobacillus fastidiosus]